MKYINFYSRDLSARKWPENFYFNLMIISSAVLFIVFSLVAAVSLVRYVRASRESKDLEKRLEVLRAQDKTVQDMSVILKRLAGDNRILEDSVKELENLSGRSVPWTDLIVKLSSLLNNAVWMDSLVTDTLPGLRAEVVNVSVNGGGLNLNKIQQFVKKLEDEFENVKINVKINQEEDVRFYNFSLTFLWKVDYIERTATQN